MYHLTLTTGHMRVSPRSEVGDEAIAVCRLLLKPGRHAVPGVMGGYELVVPERPDPPCGWLGTVYQGDVPIATIGVAIDEADAVLVWGALKRLHHQDMPSQPSLPWCAVELHAVAAAYEWLGDFERCLAWAWIENH